jgi:hypothetical protein
VRICETVCAFTFAFLVVCTITTIYLQVSVHLQGRTFMCTGHAACVTSCSRASRSSANVDVHISVRVFVWVCVCACVYVCVRVGVCSCEGVVVCVSVRFFLYFRAVYDLVVSDICLTVNWSG